MSLESYWERTRQPLQGLLFLLPLLLAYELGTLWYTSHSGVVLPELRAQKMLQLFFSFFGVGGYFLPGLIVVAVLLAWHVVRRDPWRFAPRLYAVMWVEALLLAMPPIVFAAVLFREPAVAAGIEDVALPDTGAKLVMSIGAGIYEELVFRLIAIALLHTILVDFLALPDHVGVGLTVFLSALAFGLVHFLNLSPLAWETIHGAQLAFYTLMGIYLAGVYLVRGFGTVVGVHALYDVLAVCIVLLQRGG